MLRNHKLPTTPRLLKGAPMRVTLASLALLALLVAITGCGGSGGSGSSGSHGTTPVISYGSVDGYVYSDVTKSRLLVSHAALKSGAVVGSATKGGTRTVGSPVTGAQVSVRGYSTLTANTDATGYFTISNVPSGAELLYFDVAGFTRTDVTVTVAANTMTHADNLSLTTVAKHKWTVMVYLDANVNDSLNTEGIVNFKQMEAAPNSPIDTTDPANPTPYVETIVQYAMYGQTCKLYEVQHSTDPTNITSHLIQDLGAVDMGNPTSLNTFVTRCQTDYPAEHYALIIWDHGSGWDPASDARLRARTVNTGGKGKSAITPRAIAFDDTTGHVIRDVDLSSALTVRDPIDIVATDACLMSMLEVGYQIRHQADYLMGSEEETPLEGFNYTDLVSKVVSSYATLAPKDYAAYMAQDAFQHWTVDLGYTNSLCTSAMDLSHVDTVASSVNSLANSLLAVKGSSATQIKAVDAGVARFSPDSALSAAPSGYPYGNGPFVDLYDYASQISANVSDSSVHSAASDTMSNVTSAIVANYHTTDVPYTRAHGMSIYLPSANDYLNAGPAASYPMLDFAANTAWPTWLSQQP